MATTFDGPNLRMILDTDLLVDVETDLYSEWKIWALLGDNSKFPPAFRTVGGDELTPGVEAGAYFFLQNQDGWRIRPAEADATVLVIGNLAPEDSTLPMTVPTLGAFTVLLQGLQPITQSVTELLLAQQNATYEGAVHINTISGVAGTVFPAGTASSPVNTIADAATIATARGFTRINLTGSIVLNQTFNFFKFFGQSGVAVIDVNGQDVSGCMFERVGITGDFSAINPALPPRLIETRVTIGGLTNFRGILFDSVLEGDITLAAGLSEIIRCASGRSGLNPILADCQGNIVTLSFRGFDGGLDIRNFSQSTGKLSIDSESLRLVLGSTVTDGEIIVRGVGEIEDTSGALAIVNTEGFIDAFEAEVIHQMTAGNIDISADNSIITVFEQGSTTLVLATFSISGDGRIRRRTS